MKSNIVFVGLLMKSNIAFINHVQKLPNVPLQFCFLVILFGSIVGFGRYVFGWESFFMSYNNRLAKVKVDISLPCMLLVRRIKLDCLDKSPGLELKAQSS